MLAAALALAVFLFPVSEIGLALFKRADAAGARVDDRGSLRILWLVIAASVGLAVVCDFLSAARISAPPVLLRALALGLIVVGLAVRWISIVTLGRLFTVDVAIHTGHTLVESGLYRYVRHPSYTGLFLAFLGLGLYFANWLSLAALMAPITVAVVNRVVREERALTDALGSSYVAYCARTKRFVPGLF